jgi:nucleoside-triphosphatase
MSITIFSNPIHSGKTTSIMNWYKEYENIAGILMPDVNGMRMFYDIKSRELFPAQFISTRDIKEELISVGGYFFSKENFKRANQILLATLSSKPSIIIVDEIGKLELAGEGFFPAVKNLINYCTLNHQYNLVLVIREELLDVAKTFFQLQNARVISRLNEF